MKYKVWLGVALIAAVFIINSCENKEALLPMATGLPAGCDTSKVTYSSGVSNTIQATINSQCAVAGCHVTGSPGHNYTTYAHLRADASGGTGSNMWKYLFDNPSDRMPKTPQAGWDSCMAYQFKAWLLAGAPQ